MRAVKMFAVVTVFLLVAVPNIQAADKGKTEPYTIVTSEELKAMLDRQEPGLVVIDARNPEEFQEVHIRSAVNIPWPRLEKDKMLLSFPKETKIVFYCNGFKWGKSIRAARLAAEIGYKNLFVLHEGMPVWEEKGYAVYAGPDYEKRIETTKIAPKELKALMDAKPGALTLVDVRDPQEFAEGHIPGAINIPSNIFAAGSAVLDKEKLIVVYCKSGGRSYTAYRKLQKLDYSKIAQAILADWEEAGLPVEK